MYKLDQVGPKRKVDKFSVDHMIKFTPCSSGQTPSNNETDREEETGVEASREEETED